MLFFSSRIIKYLGLFKKLSESKMKMLNHFSQVFIHSEMELALKEFHGKQTVKHIDVFLDKCFVLNEINFIYAKIRSFVLLETASKTKEVFFSLLTRLWKVTFEQQFVEPIVRFWFPRDQVSDISLSLLYWLYLLVFGR